MMNIYVSHSTSLDYKKELYEPIRSSELNKVHHFILPHEFQDTPYSVKTEMQNKLVDVVIADISLPSTGQGIELGWANMFSIPIICIYKSGSKISGSPKVVTDLFYEYENNMIEAISQALKKYETKN